MKKYLMGRDNLKIKDFLERIGLNCFQPNCSARPHQRGCLIDILSAQYSMFTFSK